MVSLRAGRVVTGCTIHINDEQQNYNGIERSSEDTTVAKVLEKNKKQKKRGKIILRSGTGSPLSSLIAVLEISY